jgi:cytochrome c6
MSVLFYTTSVICKKFRSQTNLSGMKTIVMVLALVAFRSFISVGQPREVPGQKVFKINCTRCHGEAGDKGKFGAKDLTRSNLEATESKRIIETGKGFMPAWRKRLTTKEIDDVIQYIISLRRMRDL